MKLLNSYLIVILACSALSLRADNSDIQWLVSYDGNAVPDSTWTAIGKPNAKIEDAALRIVDDSSTESAGYEAEWSGDLAGKEIIVEARVKVVSTKGLGDSATAIWPWRDGAPITVHVSDGMHQEGLLLTPPAYTDPGMAEGYVRTLTDRFHQANTMKDFHTYRLVIRGSVMAIEMDGKRVIQGRDAFWKAADSPRRFIRFGSTSDRYTSESRWGFVRLGLRIASTPEREKSPLRITVGEPFALPVEKKNTESRPYLYNVGQGLLLMSTPQGTDAILEPYAVRRSMDAGKTWSIVPGLDQNVESPQEMVRLADGRILGPSRWTWLQPDGSLKGKTTLLDAKAETYTAHDSRTTLPAEFMPAKNGEVFLFERHIWAERDGSITAVAWSKKTIKLANKRNFPERRTHLMRSTNLGNTWTHLAHIGLGGEPAIVRLSEQEWLAVTRPDAHMSNLLQFRSLDGGHTWRQEAVLEEGCADPDLVLMSDGVLACSYGRPASCLMFSTDGGRYWSDHRIISDRVNFNYTAIREITPGRLLYIHDAPLPGTLSRINSVYVDVELVK